MGRIGCCLILGVAVVICGGAPNAAERPSKNFSVAFVAFGETGGATATQAVAEAKRALTESLSTLGARVFGRVVADARPSPKVRQTIAVERRAAQAPAADVVIGLSAKPVHRVGAYTAHLTMSLRAVLHAVGGDAPPRIINAQRRLRLPTSCPKACVARIGARMAGEQAQALASDIFRQAARMVSTTGRRLSFRGFSGRELGEIHQYLRAFPGFRRMGRGVRRSKDTVIRYQSRLGDLALGRALKKMLGHMRISAEVSRRGRGYTVARNAGPAKPNAMPWQW